MTGPKFEGLEIGLYSVSSTADNRAVARKAEAEGMVVIDDPVSILRCTNKVFLADLLGMPIASARRIPQDNGGVNIIRQRRATLKLLTLNSNFHLWPK